MIMTDTGAYQAMCAAVRTVVASSDMLAVVGYKPELRYVDISYNADPPAAKLWVRFSIAQAGEKKRTLSQPSRITKQGIADMQLFVPTGVSDPAKLGRDVAELLQKVYARSAAGVDFFRAGIRDMPKENAWYYKRISADYNYDTYV